MKQVDQSKYSLAFFLHSYNSPDYQKPINQHVFPKKFQEIVTLINIKPIDTIVDFGCGNGDFIFYLCSKYNCHIIGIDYSPTAIKICQQKLAQFIKVYPNLSKKIKFIQSNNDHLPDIKKVRAVFLNDVIEHMYDHEIKIVFDKFRTWNQSPYPKILIHTDNNLYLRFFHWAVLLLSLLTHKITSKQIKIQQDQNKQYHINLTNQYQLEKNMRKLGFIQVSLSYP